MRAFISKHKKLTIAVVAMLMAFLWIWSPLAYARGRLAAYLDIARGRYVILGYGLPAQDRPAAAQLLRERYGVEFRAVAGCIVSRSLIDYASGYDAVSIPAANRKFGRDIFNESYLAAQSMRAAKISSEEPR